MKNAKTRSRSGFTLVELLVVIAIIVALAALATPQIFKALKRANLAEALNNAKQVKYALDGFATDFDGQYPNDDTAERVSSNLKGGNFSNNYFRQLFMTLETSSEKIFWVKDSPAASKSPPDDKVKDGGKPSVELILEAGDCHWAYMTEQTNTSDVSRPLILDPFNPTTGEFDPNLWDLKAVVCRIDGSVKAERMRLDDNKVLDGDAKDFLSTSSSAWENTGENPQQLLKQPQTRSN